MSEGEQNMPSPEQRPEKGPEQTTPKPQDIFEGNIRRLIEPQKEIDSQGQEVEQPAQVQNFYLRKLAERVIRNPRVDNLASETDRISDWLAEKAKLVEEGKLSEAEYSQLENQAFLLSDSLSREFYRQAQETEKVKRETPSSPSSEPIEANLSELNGLLDRVVMMQEGVIESNRVARENSERLMQAFIGYTETMREAYSHLPPEEEKERWVDVELQQDFYTRFVPNNEPKFYTKLESSERREWDARWQLARAAFWKKIYSARPEDLSKNQDLIELTTEQMEVLYNIEGVREGLRWYTRGILGKIDIYKSWDEESGEPTGNSEKKSLVECKSGREFEEFRKNLQYSLKRKVAGVTREQEEDWIKREKEGDKDAEEKLRDLRTRIKSADAIAWNFIWASNLVESVDSRYSLLGDKKLRKRHSELAPAICSDDLRAVFHPQEKFENKCLGKQEWGCYGVWGKMQLDFITDEFGKRKEENTVFKPARFRRDFWQASGRKEGEVEILVPECYPITTMKSFLETENYKCKNEREEEKLFFEHFLEAGEGGAINWSTVGSDLWKTNYLTVRLPKAIGLFSVFKDGEGKPGWTKDLLDIFVRLGTKRELIKYYTSLSGGDIDKGTRLGSVHFQNLKVWAYFAPFGGVGRPQDKKPTDPFSDARIRIGSKIDLSDREYILRKPQNRYLGQKERLVIKDIV